MSKKLTLIELLERNPPPAPPKEEAPKKRKRWWRKEKEQPARLNVLAEVQKIADRAWAAGHHPRDISRAIDEVADRVRQRAAMSMPLSTSIF
jgi:hypothetical protein